MWLRSKKKKPDAESEESLPEEIARSERKESALTGIAPDLRAEVTQEEEGRLADALAEPRPGVLRTRDLVKRYGRRTVANQVSIEVTQGEIVGLLGPNGAGKTTTFYMPTGLITPNAGKIYLDDKDIG